MRKAIMASSVAVPEAPPADESKPGVDEFAKTGELGTVIGESASTAGPAQGAEGCRPGDRQGRWLAR